MRALPLLALAVLLVACGAAAPTASPTPTPARDPTAADLLTAIEESGLALTRKPSQNIHTCATQEGLNDYQEFVQREDVFYPRHAVASYNTAQQAETARAACARQRYPSTTLGWRRGTVVLIWASSSNVPADAWLPYFAVLQSLR